MRAPLIKQLPRPQVSYEEKERVNSERTVYSVSSALQISSLWSNLEQTRLSEAQFSIGICFAALAWLSITDIKILKRVGILGIDDMRLIQLMYPRFWINNKLVGKKVLANVEICDEVAKEQHGSRKHHQAGLLVLDEVLVDDLLRLTRRAGYCGMNDIRGSSDPIEHVAAILDLVLFGLAYTVTTTL